MLALPSLRAQTGLTGRDFVVGCVAESDPRSLDQALRLVQSIRWFGGELAIAQVMVCVVGGLDPSLRQAFEDDPGLRDRLGRAARATAELWDWRHQAVRYEAMFQAFSDARESRTASASPTAPCG